MLIRVLFVMAALISIPFVLFGSMYSPEILNAADPVLCPDAAYTLIADPETRFNTRGAALVAGYFCENADSGERYEVTFGWTVGSIAFGFLMAYLVLRFPGIPRRDPVIAVQNPQSDSVLPIV